ncbi:MAG: lauroyl acyltransferase [Pseudomonadota bacterium]
MPMYKDGRRDPGAYKRFVQYPLEALAVCLLIAVLKVLPIDTASNLGGAVGRRLGPKLGATKRARKNLARAMPELDAAAREQVIIEMWDNLGRTIAEYPHMGKIWRERESRIEDVGFHHYQHTMGDRPCIFVSGHMGNWELSQCGSRSLATELGLIYRRANNPLVNAILLWLRKPASSTFFHKGPDGAKKSVRHLKNGGHLGMLVDQKLNEGVPVTFFGIPAMTAPAYALLALKFNARLMMARTERLNGCRFRITVTEPLTLPDTGDREADTLAILTNVNQQLEAWIKERPAQWLWLHKRWPEEAEQLPHDQSST